MKKYNAPFSVKLAGYTVAAVIAGSFLYRAHTFPGTLPLPLWLYWLIASMLIFGVAATFEPVPAGRRAYLYGALFLSIWTFVFAWVAFGPGDRHFIVSSSGGLGPIEFGSSAGREASSEISGRIAFGVFAIMSGIITAWVWRKWRRSRRP